MVWYINEEKELTAEALERTQAARLWSGQRCKCCGDTAVYIVYEVFTGYIPGTYLCARCESCGTSSHWITFGKQSMFTEEKAIERAYKELDTFYNVRE